ncbi:MAG TPA: nucleotidyl transferase AbiEii/AbiGii toxin family protein [Thermoanaerobaculia bacterium]|nr:nucleotidyl transferase AbiEii/AbiGii toxin family protein [Thermoanaerobaculia bacterium]
MAKRPSQKLRNTLADLTKALERIEAPSMVIGGIAVIAHGVARQTIDIDATVLATRLETSQILAVLASCSIRPRIVDVLEFAERSQVLLLVHEKTRVTLEISLAFSPFEREALERAVEVDFGGVRIPVAVPEDLVIYKALAWRDQDRYDIEQLLTLHGDHIDLERVRTFVHEFSQILGAPERIPEFDRLLRRILGPAQ